MRKEKFYEKDITDAAIEFVLFLLGIIVLIIVVFNLISGLPGGKDFLKTNLSKINSENIKR